MKILELIPNLSPGGAQRFVVDLCNEFVNYEDVDISIVLYGTSQKDATLFYKDQLDTKIKLIEVPRKDNYFDSIKCIFRIYNLIKKEMPDIVHCHLQAYSYTVLPSVMLRDKTVYIQTNHNNPYKNIVPGYGKFLKTIYYKYKFIRLVTISPTCKRYFNDYMGFECDYMIENGCRSIKCSDELDCVAEEIRSYKKTENTVVFVNIARLQYQKHHELLIESFNRLIENGYDAILLQIGNKDANKDQLEKLESLNRTDRVYFLGPKRNVQDYLYSADAFCLSSRWEGAPISLLEAGFCGCYPLCTPVCGCIDVIVDESWGRLSEDETPEAYYELLRSYAVNRPNITRGDLSQKYYDKYNMKACAKSYIGYFQSVIKDKKTIQ